MTNLMPHSLNLPAAIIRFSPSHGCGGNDRFGASVNRRELCIAFEFLEQGNRVKFSLMFRGRENAHRELGFELMKRVTADIAEVATVEQLPRLQGRNIFMMVVPKKTK